MRRSLAGISVAVTALVAVAFLVPLALLVGSAVRQRVVGDAFRVAAAISPVLVVATSPGDVQRVVAGTPSGSSGRLTVYLPDALTGPTPDGAGPNVIGTARAGSADLLRAARTGQSFTAPVRGGLAVLQPVLLGPGRTAVVVVVVPDSDLNRGVWRARLILVGLALALVAGSVAVADRLAGRVVRSARELSTAAGRLGAGDLAVRIDPQGPDELRDAAIAFNTMAARVSTLLSAERELAADLSHRLRTPLTALLLACRGLENGTVEEQVRATVAQLEAEIGEIIRRTRQSPTSPVSCDDVVVVLRERLEFWGVLAEDENRAWALHAPDLAIPAEVTAEDLAAATDALLGNVFVHTPAGHPFTVSVTGGPEAVQVTVDDAGPGILDPKRALRRGSSGAGSTGLGLDIARRLAESTGGGLRIGTSPMGGARVELVLRRTIAGPGLRELRTRRRVAR